MTTRRPPADEQEIPQRHGARGRARAVALQQNDQSRQSSSGRGVAHLVLRRRPSQAACLSEALSCLLLHVVYIASDMGGGDGLPRGNGGSLVTGRYTTLRGGPRIRKCTFYIYTSINEEGAGVRCPRPWRAWPRTPQKRPAPRKARPGHAATIRMVQDAAEPAEEPHRGPQSDTSEAGHTSSCPFGGRVRCRIRCRIRCTIRCRIRYTRGAPPAKTC